MFKSARSGLRRLAVVTFTLAATAFVSPVFAQSRDGHMSAARAQAIRECSRIEERYPEHEWGNREYFEYLACMARHSQTE